MYLYLSHSMTIDNRLWKVQADDGPDPIIYKALLSDYHLGYKAAQDEVSRNPEIAVHSAIMNLEAGEITSGAKDVVQLMTRIIQTGRRGGIATTPERLSSRLSEGLSKVVYNLGKCAGYRDSQQ